MVRAWLLVTFQINVVTTIELHKITWDDTMSRRIVCRGPKKFLSTVRQHNFRYAVSTIETNASLHDLGYKMHDNLLDEHPRTVLGNAGYNTLL